MGSIEKGNELKTELLLINPNCQIDTYEGDLKSIESTKNCAKLIATKYPAIDVLTYNVGILDY